MIIKGIEVDMRQLANAVASAYTMLAVDPNHVQQPGDITNLTQVYLRAYLEVMESEREYLEALV